ncbi:MAG TPA: FliM/FliN family flagellar motor switch protein [Bryobacteraceae bacterium]|jgi:flagellar motor switch protein FliN/FliY|nr:FliM/FliN family flagellar motor switch protein [Bryobacteraceae bacterium]
MSNTYIDQPDDSELESAQDAHRARQLEAFAAIGDVEVPLLAEVDRLNVSVRELLRWKIGQIITLNRPTGENIDLFAGDVLIGNAEILIVDEKLAVRVADLKDKAPVIHNPAPLG